MEAEIAIVGGGLAGLLQGALLCKKAKVLIIERSGHLGGLFQTIQKGEDNIYIGAHCIGGIFQNGVWKQCFNVLGLQMEDFFEEIESISISIKGQHYRLPIRLSALHKFLKDMFPEENKMDAFFDLLFEYNKAFVENDKQGLKKMFCKTVNRTFEDFLSDYFLNQSLKMLLLSYIPAYVGIGMNGNAFTAVSILITYSMGTAYIKDNNNILIERLQKIILDNSGTILYDSKVKSILKESEKYTVMWIDKDSKEQYAKCSQVIVACYPKDILLRSFPKAKTIQIMEKLNKGPSAIRLICKVPYNMEDHVDTELMYYGMFDYEDIDKKIFFEPDMQNLPICMVSFPTRVQDKHKGYTYVMVTILTYKIDLKNDVKTKIIELIKKDLPDLYDKIIESDIFLPSFYKDRVGYMSGSVFGWERNRSTNLNTNTFTPDIKENINIFLAGQWSADFGIYGNVRNAMLIYEKFE